MLALRKALADTDDRRDAVIEQDLRLGIDLQVGLAVVTAALAVADDAVLGTEVAELLGDSSPLYQRLYDEGLINGSFGGGFDQLPGVACLLDK